MTSLLLRMLRTRNLTVEKSGQLGLVIQEAVNKMVPATGKILTLQDLKASHCTYCM